MRENVSFSGLAKRRLAEMHVIFDAFHVVADA